MPYSGGGVFTLTPGYTAVTGQTILPSQHNPPLEDIASSLNLAFLRDGRAAATGNWNLGGNRLTGLADAVDPGDAPNKGQVQSLINSVPYRGDFRNKLINGDWEINERGSSSYNSAGYGFDRWVTLGSGLTVSVQAYAPVLLNGIGATGVNFVLSTVGAQYLQRIENVNTLQGQRVTLTYWVFDTAGGRDLNTTVLQNFGQGGSSAVLVPSVVGLGTTSVTVNGFKKIQKVYDLPSTNGKTVGPGNNLSIYLLNPGVPVSGALFRASLVEGDATSEVDPFAPRDLMTEKSLCQRYYEKGLVYLGCSAEAGKGFGMSQSFMVGKRAVPSIVYSGMGYVNASGVETLLATQNSFIHRASSIAAGTVVYSGQYAANAELEI